MVSKSNLYNTLTNRQKRLLSSVIEYFQASGEPASSKWLASEGGFTESSATIRAELGNLEDMGYLGHLHTSGGRFPTDSGYHLYIEQCLLDNSLNDPILSSYIKNSYHQYAGDSFEFGRAIGIFLAKRLSMPVISSVDDGIYCWKGGLSYIGNYEEMLDQPYIMPIISFIDEFEYTFAPVIDKITYGRDISVLIGKDNALFGLESVALIIANYNLPSSRRGRLVIIGPVRMEYQNILPYISNIIYELNKLK